jgi:heme iron utilization protein
VPETTPILDQLRELFASQRLAVLATDQGGQPYVSLVAFTVSDDLRELLFATNRDTRKFDNLKANNRVSLLIDNRSNQVADFSRAIAVTLLGAGEELAGADRPVGEALYLAKHPHLEEFVTSPGCALVRVHLQSCYLVSRFQDVVEHHFS